jgi:hypothetical protein
MSFMLTTFLCSFSPWSPKAVVTRVIAATNCLMFV